MNPDLKQHIKPVVAKYKGKNLGKEEVQDAFVEDILNTIREFGKEYAKIIIDRMKQEKKDS